MIIVTKANPDMFDTDKYHTVYLMYHKLCADGFTAYLQAYKFFTKHFVPFRSVPVGYDKAAEADISAAITFVAEKKKAGMLKSCFIFLDYCPSVPIISSIMETGSDCIILDHHKTAFIAVQNWLDSLDSEGIVFPASWGNLETYFDMEKSGARLAHEFFNGPDKQPSLLTAIVEDRDLWKFQYPFTKHVMEYIFSIPYDEMAYMSAEVDLDGRGLEKYADMGMAIYQKKMKDIKEIVDNSVVPIILCGYRVPFVNFNYILSSEGLNYVLDIIPDAPFAASASLNKNQRMQFSLRSRDDRVDVSYIAKLMGGGGHRNASGFEISFNDFAMHMQTVNNADRRWGKME